MSDQKAETKEFIDHTFKVPKFLSTAMHHFSYKHGVPIRHAMFQCVGPGATDDEILKLNIVGRFIIASYNTLEFRQNFSSINVCIPLWLYDREHDLGVFIQKNALGVGGFFYSQFFYNEGLKIDEVSFDDYFDLYFQIKDRFNE